MNLADKNNQYSNYALWEELYNAVLTDFEENKMKQSSYLSPICNTCKNWMAKAGDAIKGNDDEKIYHYLWNIAHLTMEPIGSHDSGRFPGETEEWMKPYYEYNLAAMILMVKTGTVRS